MTDLKVSSTRAKTGRQRYSDTFNGLLFAEILKTGTLVIVSIVLMTFTK